jgi:hypothetical protein
MPESLPYINSPGTIEAVLAKIQPAATPPKFDAKFLEEKLHLKGGGYRSFIPFAKRIGLLSHEGTPTALYTRFRVEGNASTAMAEALRIGYKPLFDSNERAHLLSRDELNGLVVQVTGTESGSSVLRQIVGCFNVLKNRAKFDAPKSAPSNPEEAEADEEEDEAGQPSAPTAGPGGLRIAYTINLNLPESSDPKVFNAIFTALRKHLLTEIR